MVMRSKENSLGAWAFLLGVVLAIVVGLSTSSFLSLSSITRFSAQIYGILVIIGLVIGFLNVTNRDSQTFMISGAILVIVSRFGMESVTGSLIGIGIGDVVTSIFGALLALFVPATIVVALKTLFSISNV